MFSLVYYMIELLHHFGWIVGVCELNAVEICKHDCDIAVAVTDGIVALGVHESALVGERKKIIIIYYCKNRHCSQGPHQSTRVSNIEILGLIFNNKIGHES